MKVKSNVLLAIVAVALMLGCALVPIVSDYNANDVVAEDANDDATDDMSISDILESLMDANDGERGYFFIPVETPTGDVKTLDTKVEGPHTVPSGDIVTLSGDYVFTNNGKIVIGKGATLSLFASTEAKGCSLTNKNGTHISEDDVIVMEPGSKLSFFGMTFELIGSKPFNMISMSADKDGAANCKLTFNSDESGYTEFRVNASEGLYMTFAELVSFKVELPDRDVIVVSGIFKSIFLEIGFTFSGTISISEIKLKEYSNSINSIWNYPGSVVFKVDNLSFSYDLNSAGADVKLSASVSTDYTIKLLSNRAIITGFALEFKDISLGITRSNDDETLEMKLNSPGSVAIRFGQGGSWKDQVEKFHYELTAKDLAIGFDISDYYSKFELGKKGWALNKMTVDGNISLTCVETTVAMEYSGLSLSLMFTGNLNINSIHYESNDEGDGVTIGQVTSSGVVSSMEMAYTLKSKVIQKLNLKSLTISIELLYGIESNTSVTNISISNKGKTTTIEFEELRSDFAAVRGGADWNGELKINKFKLGLGEKKENDESNALKSLSIGSVYLRNDIPMQQALSHPIITTSPIVDLGLDTSVVCIPTISMELNNVVYDSSKKGTAADYLRVNLKDYRGVEELSIEFKESVNIRIGGKEGLQESKPVSIVFNANSISGFVKNTGCEKKDFSIDSSPEVALKLYYETKQPENKTTSVEEMLNYNFSLEVRGGNAKFNGGSLPIVIEAGKDASGRYASFDADGLTAFGFVFDENCTIKGTISLDTDAALPLFFNKDFRAIKIGEGYSLTPATNGYVITLDLSKRTEGTLVANQGSKLPNSFDMGVFSMTSNDQKTGTFIVSKTGAKVELECIRERYNLTYMGISESHSYAYGSVVTLSTNYPQKSGLDFYGWNDGTKIYKPFDTLVMPSHDVVLEPVYIKVADGTKVLEGSTTVLVVQAPDADLVRVNVADVGWDIMRVTVGNTTFEIDEQTFYNQCYVKGDQKRTPPSLRPILFQSTAVETDGGEICRDLRVYVIDKDEVTLKEVTKPFRSYGTIFNTTVNVKADSNVKGFNVYEIDDKGNRLAIDDVTFTLCDDGTYDIGFTINHAANYVIEPVYEDAQFGQDNILTAIIGIAVILICAVGIGFCWTKRDQLFHESDDPTKGDNHE